MRTRTLHRIFQYFNSNDVKIWIQFLCLIWHVDLGFLDEVFFCEKTPCGDVLVQLTSFSIIRFVSAKVLTVSEKRNSPSAATQPS